MAMQLIHAEGWDEFSTVSGLFTKYQNIGIADTILSFVTANVPTGQALNFAAYTSTTKQVRFALPTDYLTMSIQWRARWDVLPVAGTHAFLNVARPDGTLMLSINCNDGGEMDLRTGGSLDPDTVFTITAGQVHHFQLNVGFDNSGWMELYVDSNQEYTDTGDTLSATHETGFLNLLSTDDSTSTYWIDDIVVYADTAYIASPITPYDALSVINLKPNANGTNRDFTPSTGTDDFAVVDEDDPDDTDYLEANVLNDLVTMGYEAVNIGATDVIAGVVVDSYYKTDAGSRDVRNVTLSNVTQGNGATETIGTGLSHRQSVFETDPDTAAAWTEAGLDAAEFGSEIVS